MALTATGIGSGLDITSIVKTLVDAERSPKETLFDANEKKIDAKVSAIGTLKSSLSTFQDALDKLKSGDALNLRTVTQSSKDYFTATADKNAKAGSYNIIVESLAQAHKVAGAATTSSSSTVGEGSLALTANGKSFSVDIESTDTLAGIADKVNNASDNKGITATVITTDEGSRLVFSANETGTDNEISVTATDTSGTGLSDMFGSTNLLQLQSAKNAVVYIDGQKLTSQSNSVKGGITGVTLDLTSTDLNKTTKLTIAKDTDGVKTNIQNFVDAYNTLMDKMSSLSSYDADTKTAGALQGDSLVSSLQSQLRSKISSRVTTDTGSVALYDIGIKTDRYGKLSVDSTKLDKTLANNMSDIESLFSSSDGGIAKSLDNLVEGYVKTRGLIDSRNSTYTEDKKRLDDQRDALDIKMELLQARLTKQFNAMDLAIGQINSQSSSVTSALASLPGLVSN